MPIAATLLFGSLARADQTDGSDTDLLLIGLDDETRHVTVGHLSLFLYPWAQLKQDARDGDLFVCHLVQEARPLIDPEGYLERLRQAFRYRESYATEIGRATDLAWFLAVFGTELNPQLLFKRALWCVRTILIARSVEARQPVFAPARLAETASSALARDLLLNRRTSRDRAAVQEVLRDFLVKDLAGDRWLDCVERAALIKRFETTVNKVALQTLRQENDSQASYRG
jgi:hypothetical protein